MLVTKHDTWKNWYQSLPENEDGNKNMRAFSGALEPGKSDTEKIRTLTKSPNHVFLAANCMKMLKIFTVRSTLEECSSARRTRLHA